MGISASVAMASKSWPFQEARQLLKRIERSGGGKDKAVFQTGYGPSGLPHIGTFGEVARTTMVRKAFELISGMPTKLICFSDDLDGFRKVPENVPDREKMKSDLDLPLCKVRDPFGTHESFAAHNNSKLRTFLDRFEFDYEFMSSAECYRSGVFDEMLLRVLERFDKVMEVMMPSLGGVSKERIESYSPFLPISSKTGRVLQVPTLERNVSKGTIVYEEPDGERVEISVLGGAVKLQWKPDWAMRWVALNVDYEMYGKDLIPSAELGSKLCRALGGSPPVGMAYELFLDKSGQKISKSKGIGGVTVDEWLAYASAASLATFMFQKPKTAKRLYHEIIPKSVDDYHRFLRSYKDQDDAARLSNPVWHVHWGNPPRSTMSISYSMLLNLASAASADNDEILWGFINKYEPNASLEANPDLATAVAGAVRYFQDQVKPHRQFKQADTRQRDALYELRCRLWFWAGGNSPEEIQTLVYAIGKKHQFDPLRDWFTTMYEVLFGTSDGPRMGGFIALYGLRQTASMVANNLMAENKVSDFDVQSLLLPTLLYLSGQPDGVARFENVRNALVEFLESRIDGGSMTKPSQSLTLEVITDAISEKSSETSLYGRNLIADTEDQSSIRITAEGLQAIDLD